MKKTNINNKSKIISSLLLAFVAVSVLSIFAFIQKNKKQVTILTPNNIVSDWKGYTNNDFKFSIKYPGSYSLKEIKPVISNEITHITIKKDDSDLGIDVNVIISPYINPEYKTNFEKYLKENNGPIQNYLGVASIKRIFTNNGTLGYLTTYNADGNSYKDNYYSPEKKYITLPNYNFYKYIESKDFYITISTNDEKNLEILSLISSTFKFTD